MTLITENGWPQIPASMLDRGPVPGTRAVVELREGDVSTVLKGWAAWYHRNVERIDAGQRDEWGWSPTNDVWNSNHLSGTAIDINATQYPWQQYTMPAARVAAVERGLDLFEGTVFWGRWWDRPDEMHYQINCDAEELARFAAKLRAGYLGIYASEDDTMTDDDRRILREAWEQLRGPGGKGWPQLGKNAKGEALTLVDAVAELSAQLTALAAVLAASRKEGGAK